MSTTTKKLILDKTQQRVYDYMCENKGITTFEANHQLGETRLSARIFELKEKGVNIEYEWLNVNNRYGEARRVKKYFIAGGAERQRVEAITTCGGVCEVCGKPLTNSTWQGAHRIANTKTNRAHWGSWIIDHPMNIAIVCSLACNHVCNIGYNQGECLRLVKKIVEKELEKF